MGVTDPSSVSTLSSSVLLPLRAEDLVGVTDEAGGDTQRLDDCIGKNSDADARASQGSKADKKDSFLAFWPFDRVGVLREHESAPLREGVTIFSAIAAILLSGVLGSRALRRGGVAGGTVAAVCCLRV